MQVKLIERNVFLVEGDSLFCESCGKVFARRPNAPPWFSEKQKVFMRSLNILAPLERAFNLCATAEPEKTKCTRCGGKLQVRWLRVELLPYGKADCGCEWFSSAKGKNVAPDFTCKHIEAARHFALDMVVTNGAMQEQEPAF